MKTTAAYNKGYDAWRMGDEPQANTYRPGSDEWADWLDGYADAQEQDHDPYTTWLGAFAWLVILAFVVACVYFWVIV